MEVITPARAGPDGAERTDLGLLRTRGREAAIHRVGTGGSQGRRRPPAARSVQCHPDPSCEPLDATHRMARGLSGWRSPPPISASRPLGQDPHTPLRESLQPPVHTARALSATTGRQ